MSIVLYSAKICGDCQLLKDYMDTHGIAYELRDIHEDPQFGEDVRTHTGKLGVPYLVIDGTWVRGYDTVEPFSETFAASLFERS